jgi:hypothetical protein
MSQGAATCNRARKDSDGLVDNKGRVRKRAAVAQIQAERRREVRDSRKNRRLIKDPKLGKKAKLKPNKNAILLPRVVIIIAQL